MVPLVSRAKAVPLPWSQGHSYSLRCSSEENLWMDQPEASGVAQGAFAAETVFGKYRMSEPLFLGIIGLTALIYNRGTSKLGQLGAQKCNFHNTEHISFFLSAHTEAEQATQILGKQFISKADCFLSWEKFVDKYVKYSPDQWSGNWSPDFPNSYVSFLFLFLRGKWPEI